MEKNWLVLLLMIVVIIAALVMVMKRNFKDRKGLFKKLPGDYPKPTEVKSEFDRKD
jgi:uncharacterized protein YxeA